MERVLRELYLCLMRYPYFLFLFLFSISTSSLYSQKDTAQVVVPGRINSLEAQKAPYVVLISVDGLRPDYLERFGAKHLLALKKSGVSSRRFLPSYPSITGPNHYAMITGLYPSHSGFVDNHFYDREREDSFAMSKAEKITDGTWLKGLPLWGLAERQGMLSASLFWVASNGTAGGTRPTYYYPYHEEFSAEKRVDIAADWLGLPEEKRPHFISMYFFEVDKAGHLYGTSSKEVREAVLMVDKAVGDLQKRIDSLGLKDLHLILVSDHGMTDVEVDTPLEIPAVLRQEGKVKIYNSQTLLRVMVHNPKDVQPLYRKLKKEKTSHYKVYLASRFPKRLQYRSADDAFDRMGEIFLVPSHPKIFLGPGDKATPGKHGYDPYKVKDMHSVFIAKGPRLKNNKTVRGMKNVDLYPLVAEILGLEMLSPTDGRLRRSKAALR
ncbi:alkaline phosphatase family protein [Planobacterium oryzisoli]|nr:ectonucleotide pyrophosphatase/phosphodiesterase [Planobacterium oryzisoli]